MERTDLTKVDDYKVRQDALQAAALVFSGSPQPHAYQRDEVLNMARKFERYLRGDK